MIIQEPVQAAIWHCLDHYAYSDAIFLSERLYAEVKNDDSLFLLSTAYYRNGQKDHAYHMLKERTSSSAQCKYLFGMCAFELGRYAEAEAVLFEGSSDKITTFEDIKTEFGDQAPFAYALLGKIAAKTERKAKAIEAWNKALHLNPFLWSTFEDLCNIGHKPNPQNIFQISNVENFSMCHGSNLSNVESVIIPNSTPTHDSQDSSKDIYFIATPQQILANYNPSVSVNSPMCTPEESPLAHPLAMSGFGLLPSTRLKPLKFRLDANSSPSPQPSFGFLFDNNNDNFAETPTTLSQQTLTESNNYNQSLPKRLKGRQIIDNFMNRKESILQNAKPVFNQCINVPMTKTPTIPLNVQPGPNVRRSSRLFSSSYSVKENNKSPNRNKFATPKSPSKKTKQRVSKCVSKTGTYAEINTRNAMEKEKSETITSPDVKTDKSAINSNLEQYMQKVFQVQKQSAEGLMQLLKNLGQAYLELSSFNCQAAVNTLNALPSNQFQSTWVYSLLGLAYFEMADYESSIKFFNEVHIREPYRLKYMDVYSTALWHLQKEVALSALAQNLIHVNKTSPITWCVNGNCFSLHKEHDTAIKFFQRAVQVDPNFPYAFTLLGHEYITTEELDKAMSCFRNAIRLDPRHYNAWFGIGTIYSKQERYNLAEMNYSRALSINPQSSVILCHIGVVQHALKHTEKALNTLNVAIANDSKNPLCKFHRGSIYFALGRHAEALQELEELKEIVPKESLVYYLIGKVHKKLGNTDLALMHFSWATDLDPKGASSQIKEAFDPSIGRSAVENDSPSSPAGDEYNLESNFGQQQQHNYGAIPDDSDYSF